MVEFLSKDTNQGIEVFWFEISEHGVYGVTKNINKSAYSFDSAVVVDADGSPVCVDDRINPELKEILLTLPPKMREQQ
jgi:hypothetical protein